MGSQRTCSNSYDAFAVVCVLDFEHIVLSFICVSTHHCCWLLCFAPEFGTSVLTFFFAIHCDLYTCMTLFYQCPANGLCLHAVLHVKPRCMKRCCWENHWYAWPIPRTCKVPYASNLTTCDTPVSNVL